MIDDVDARLAKIEEALAHLQHDYDSLNKVAIEQARQLARVQRQMEDLGGRMSQHELERIRETSAKPPHY
jgi:uncharacterized coiled-coil protein SlyX